MNLNTKKGSEINFVLDFRPKYFRSLACTNENLNKSKNYDRLTEENPHKDFDNVNINKDDSKVLINIKFFLEKFDSAGENILQINKLKNFAEKERFLNV